MDGLFNNTTRDTISAVGLVLALLQILLALIYRRNAAIAGAGVRPARRSRPSALRSFFFVAQHPSVRTESLLVVCSTLVNAAASLILARYINIAPLHSPRDTFRQLLDAPLAYMVVMGAVLFEAMGIFFFEMQSDSALRSDTCTEQSWKRFLIVLIAVWILVAISVFRFADSSPGLQLFAATQIATFAMVFLMELPAILRLY